MDRVLSIVPRFGVRSNRRYMLGQFYKITSAGALITRRQGTIRRLAAQNHVLDMDRISVVALMETFSATYRQGN